MTFTITDKRELNEFKRIIAKLRDSADHFDPSRIMSLDRCERNENEWSPAGIELIRRLYRQAFGIEVRHE